MRASLFFAEALTQCWALERTHLAAYTNIGVRIARGEDAGEDELAQMHEIRAARELKRAQNRSQGISNAVAVIPVYGVLLQRANLYSEISGAASTQQISAQLAQALDDESVKSILLDVDSPGGSVFGLQELGDEIFAANAVKPIVAIANAYAASAAYWLGSQAAELHVTPSGQVGSIGVYSAHEDWSRAQEQAGIKTTLVAAGKYKTEGNEYEPLAPDARAHMQTMVDGYYQAFTQAVARGRAVPGAQVRSGMGQGRVLSAQAAKSAGMVDQISTFAGALDRARQVRPGAKAGTFSLVGGEAELRRARAAAIENRNRARAWELDFLEMGVNPER